MFDVKKIRKDFPVLDQQLFGKPFVYLDNAATTQKPLPVLETITRIYNHENSNVHRGVHHFSSLVTEQYEAARKRIADFLHVRDEKEVIFTHGTTESINLVASSFGEKFIKEGDEIILTEMEHHANIVPWQMLCKRKNAVIKIWKFKDDGSLALSELETLISKKTKLLGITQVSNTLGTVNPVKKIVGMAHRHGIPVLVDGAQGVQHVPTDVEDMDCDFYAFSGHKIYGPTGIGVLYAKSTWLEQMDPFQGGGDMVRSVTFEKTTYLDPPYKFEAGTTNYIGAIALATAIDYFGGLGRQSLFEYEDQLLKYATKQLTEIPGIRIFGEASDKICMLTFLISGIHDYDTGMILDKLGIAVRTGHHCAQPVCEHFDISGTVRASLSFYNTFEEIDQWIEGLRKVIHMLK